MTTWTYEILLALGLVTGCVAPAGLPTTPPVVQAPLRMLMETPPGISVWDGSKVSPIPAPPDTWTVTPSWTPDGRILFVSDRTGRKVWIADSDGSNAKQIGDVPPTYQVQRPQMGRNGQIVFAAIKPDSLPDSNMGIFVMNSDGSGLREIAQGMYPSLAASGNWIAYTVQTDVPFHRQIYRINIDGTGNTQLTNLGDPDYPDANAASISPDETQIAIFSGKEQDWNNPQQSLFTYGYRNIAVIQASGGPRRRLTDCAPVTTMVEFQNATKCIVADGPAWSPDGKTVIFDTIAKDGHSETGKIDVTGQNAGTFYPHTRGSVPVPLKP
jgi:Tol biopolymer transport system component